MRKDPWRDPAMAQRQHRPAFFRALSTPVVAIAILASGSGAFVPPPRPRTAAGCADRRILVGLSSSGNTNNDDGIFFDDFGDGGFSDGNSDKKNNPSSLLQSRMGQVKDAEAAYDSKIARNWRRGNWSVRGFSLDGSASYAEPQSATQPPLQQADASSPTATTTGDAPVRVSVVAAPTSSSSDAYDISLPQDRALKRDRTVAVGRSDGSIFIVTLGDEYLTSFVAAPKLVVEEDGEEGDGTTAVRVQNEWMDSNDLKDALHGDRPRTMESGVGGTDDGGAPTAPPEEGSPFEIAYQFLASERGEPIAHLVFHDAYDEGTNDGGDGIVCAASDGSGDIGVWKLPSLSEAPVQHEEPVQIAHLNGVHDGAIVALETMVVGERNLLFSACREGTFALWDLDGEKCELVHRWRCTDAGRPVSLTCADVSNPSYRDDGYGSGTSEQGNGQDVIFLGASNGYVMGYVVQELLSSASNGGGDSSAKEPGCPVPNLRFRAHGADTGAGEAVTAIKCGGDGTIPTSARLRGGGDEGPSGSGMGRNPRMSSSILLTGGEDGSVKQWEILSQKSPSSPSGVRMEHWPRLSTQRMKRRAHLFTPPHDGPVTCISQQNNDPSKFLTCGMDGSVGIWSASSGEELCRMDGFDGVSSLACLGRELLATNGMGQYVCVHDFGIDEDAAETGYDLEW